METPTAKIFDNVLSIDEPSTLENEISKLPASAGLILFANKSDVPILLLSTASIRRICKSRLIEQKDNSKRADLKNITAKIYYKTCQPKFRLTIEHYKAVKKIFDDNYKDYIKFILPKFITTNLEKNIPSFSITTQPIYSKDNLKTIGPVPTQKSAIVLLNSLEDAFGLCRRADIVNHIAESKSCPYLQMESCRGVCAGKTSRQDYKTVIANAFEAGANPAETIDKLHRQMQSAAEELNFEKAAKLKRRAEKLSTLKKKNYRWTGDLEKLRIIHVDKSERVKKEGSKKKQQSYAVFVIGFCDIVDVGDFTCDEFEKAAELVAETLKKFNSPTTCQNNEIIEQFSLVSYFLYRSSRSGFWLDVSGGFDKTAFLEQLNF